MILEINKNIYYNSINKIYKGDDIMEMATKALLISASVLISIVITALGVRLLGTMGDTRKQSETVASQINDATNSATDTLTGQLSNLVGKTSIEESSEDENPTGENGSGIQEFSVKDNVYTVFEPGVKRIDIDLTVSGGTAPYRITYDGITVNLPKSGDTYTIRNLTKDIKVVISDSSSPTKTLEKNYSAAGHTDI